MLPAPTKAELQLWDRIRDFGCVVCRLYRHIYSEPEIHHILSGGQKVSHSYVIGLCTPHHRIPGPGYESRHSDRGKSGKAAFEAKYGSEEFLYEAQGQMHGVYFKCVSI